MKQIPDGVNMKFLVYNHLRRRLQSTADLAGLYGSCDVWKLGCSKMGFLVYALVSLQ